MKSFKSIGVLSLGMALMSVASFAETRVPLSSLLPEGNLKGINISVESWQPSGQEGIDVPLDSISSDQVPFLQKQLAELESAIQLDPQLLKKLQSEHRNVSIVLEDERPSSGHAGMTDEQIDESTASHVNTENGSSVPVNGKSKVTYKTLVIMIRAGQHTASIASASEILQNDFVRPICDPNKDMGLGCYGDAAESLQALSNAMGSSARVYQSTSLQKELKAISADEVEKEADSQAASPSSSGSAQN